MLKKYNDTPAAIALVLFTLGGAFYVAQLLFMTEAWLAENGMGTESVVLARVLGFTWLGITIGLIRTFINGPDGSSTFFMALVIAQIGILINLWHQHLTGAPAVFDDAIIVSVLTALLLIGYLRVRSRL
ncbi:MAG: hypothetical protein AAEJ59_09770 [Arenicellales bacterium]|jgi:hypothetical protein